jgi:phytoene synthase
MPQQAREATTILYAFVRYADELVDNAEKPLPLQQHTSIDAFIDDWNAHTSNGPSDESHPLMRSICYLIQRYDIPKTYLDDFLSAMKQDMTKDRYATYQEVNKYMWGSASVIGLMMVHILEGRRDETTLKQAQALGEAMQLANFLRDVKEDYHLRNRIYLAQEDMDQYSVTEDMIASDEARPELKSLLRDYVQRTDALFAQGIKGIPSLRYGRFGVLYAAFRYRAYLREIIKNDYDVLKQQPQLSSLQKTTLFIRAFFTHVLS